MKKIIAFFVLLILPFLFVTLLLNYKNSLGEYYLGRNYDPSYPYLTNALNLSHFKGYGVSLIAHPGTPVQEIGVIAILFTHALQSSKPDIVKNVFDNAEFYLNNIFLLFLFLYFAAIYILGVTVYAKVKSLQSALFLQLTPFSFFSDGIFFMLTNISVEPILVLSILLLLAVIVSFLQKNEKERSSLVYVFLFGAICGLGLATKISFFPLLVIPFILIKGIRFKALFLLASFVAFFIFVYPAFTSENAARFFVWVKGLAVYSGKYGKGSENIVESSTFIENLKTIFSKNLIFTFSYILLWIILLLRFFSKYKTQIRTNKFYYLVIGILIAMTAQILIVAKHFSLYYMIPAFMFSILGLYIANYFVWSLFPDFFKIKFRRYAYQIITGIMIVVMSFLQLRKIQNQISKNIFVKKEEQKIVESLEENHANSIVVTTYGCSSKEFAMHLGSSFGGTQYSSYMNTLKEKYPDNFYFNRWNNKFYKVWDMEYTKTQLIKANKFIFQAANKDVLEKFMIEIKEFTNKPGASYKKLSSILTGESVYEITLDQE